MNELVINIIIECIIQITIFVQLFIVESIFLQQKKRSSRDKIIFFVTLVVPIVILILVKCDTIIYSIIALMLIVFYLFKGKIIYKGFVFIISFALNFIAEIITTYMMGDKVFQLLSSNILDRLYIQLGSAIIVFMCATVIKMIKGSKYKGDKNKFATVETLGLTLCTIVSILLLKIAIDIFEGTIQVINNIYFLTLVIFSAMALNFIIVVLMDRNLHTRYYKAMNDIVNKQLENQVKYYQAIEQSQREVRSIKHDMRNHLICMGALVEPNSIDELRNYISSICRRLESNDLLTQTGHVIIDAILDDKINKAKSKGIEVIDTLSNLAEVNLENVEICIVLSNALDNAIEAAERVVDTNIPRIEIELKIIKGYFRIYIKNSINKKVVIKNNFRIPTTKGNKLTHGYGVKNMKEVVEKYDGSFEMYSNDEVFVLEIMVQLQRVASP